MKIWLVIILVSVSANVNSAVPHVFVSGSSAKASEVNSNFSELDQRSSELEAKQLLEANRISNIEENISGLNEGGVSCLHNGDWTSNKHVITYSHKTSIVGNSVSLNGDIYRIIEIGFNEFGSGDYYKIKYPIKETSSNNVSGYIGLTHSNNSVKCSDFNISGFPASRNYVTESRTIQFKNNGTTKSTSKITMYYSGSIKINETLLNIYIPVSSKVNGTGTAVPNGVFDFSNSLSGVSATHDTVLLGAIDDLVDYIKIWKVQ